MNLLQMRNMVASILDYDPNVQTYKDEVSRMVNESYINWFVSRPYTFSQKTVDVYTLSDASDTGTRITPPAATGIATEPSGVITNLTAATTTTSGIPEVKNGELTHEGSVLKIASSTNSTHNTGEYIIDKIDRAGARVYVSRMSSTPRVSWLPVGGSAETVTVNVEQRFLTLPDDVNQILSCGIRNEVKNGNAVMGNIQPLARRVEEEWDLRNNLTGSPDSYIVYDSLPDHTMDAFDYVPRAGVDFKVDVSAQAGPAVGWPQGKYEFRMAYTWRGVESQWSDPFEVEISASNKTFTFTTLQTTALGVYGLRKKFYIRAKSGFTAMGTANAMAETFFRDMSTYRIDNLSAGAWGVTGMNTFVIEDSATTYAWNNNNTPINNIEDIKQLARSKPNMGYRKRIRLYPRPASTVPIQVRYCFFPKKLEDDYDLPNCPSDTHRYIVYATCSELFMKHNNPDMALYYEKKAEKELLKIDNKYFTQRSATWIKDGFQVGPRLPSPYRTLTHS